MNKAQQAPIQAFSGHVVAIRDLDDDFTTVFPAVLLSGLAVELAEMLRGVYPGTEVTVTHFSCSSSQRDKADEDTQRLKDRVIAARESEEPGKAFLRGLGYTFQKE